MAPKMLHFSKADILLFAEQELTELLQRKNSYAESNRQVGQQVEELSKHSQDLEDQLRRLQLKHESLQTSYLNAVKCFKEQLSNGTDLPPVPLTPKVRPEDHHRMVQMCDLNCNSTGKLTSSKKKKKRTGKSRN